MPNQITLTVSSGTPPYNIYVCDITNTYCYSAITFVGGTITFDSPAPLEYTTPILIKIIDSRNCESFQYYQCVPTPTPTLTPTLTPTPTGPCTCCCLAVSCNNDVGGSFTYTDCFGNVIGDVFVAGNSIVYYCGSNVINLDNVTLNYGSPCIDNTCILPIPTPTPTPSCFQYTIVSGPFGARVSFNGCCGNSGETSIILTLPTEIQKCSTTLPIVTGGIATITLFGPCPSC